MLLGLHLKIRPLLKGGVETGSMFMQYVQGVKPNVRARTAFIEIYANVGWFVSISRFNDYFATAQIASPKVQVGQPKR